MENEVQEVMPVSIPAEVADSVIENEDGSIEFKPSEEGNPDEKGTSQTTTEDQDADKDSELETEQSEDAGDENTDEEGAEETEEDETDEFDLSDDTVFEKKITDTIKELKALLTKEEREQLIKDIPNHQKFMALNTKKSQDVAREAKALSELLTRIGGEDVTQATESLKSVSEEDMTAILATTDDWFESAEKNPVRMMVDALTKAVPEAGKVITEAREKSERERDLDTKEEILKLRSLKDSPFDYSEDKEVMITGKLADKHGIELVLAHKLRESDILKVKTTELDDKVKSLRKELKERNEEVKKLKSAKQPEVHGKGPEGKSATRESYKEPPTTEAEARERMSRAFELMADDTE